MMFPRKTNLSSPPPVGLWALGLVLATATVLPTSCAFAPIPSSRSTARDTFGVVTIEPTRLRRRGLTLGMSVGGGDDVDDHDDAAGLGAGELTSALAKLDRKWELTQRKGVPSWGWQKLVLDDNKDESSDETTSSSNPYFPTLEEIQQDYVYLLEPPPPTSPSCVILFLGGAGLGQFPHIAYSELLTRVSKKLNAAIIAAPYPIRLDHFELAKRGGELLRKAVIKCEDERSYNPKLPKFALGHSLGAKLHTISMAATGMGQDLDGVGFLSFNNFGFADTISMARSFARELRNNEGVEDAIGGGSSNPFGTSGMEGEELFDGIMNLAETAVGLLGVEFTPDAPDTERIIGMRYDTDLQDKTRLFVFDDDDLDSSQSFVDCCRTAATAQSGEGTEDGGVGGDKGKGLTVSGLPGTHLTPVYLKFGLDDLDLPEEAREAAGQVTGGIESASFGSEENLDRSVDEICDWCLGKDPKRGPVWDGGKEEERGTQRLISGGVADAEVE